MIELVELYIRGDQFLRGKSCFGFDTVEIYYNFCAADVK